MPKYDPEKCVDLLDYCRANIGDEETVHIHLLTAAFALQPDNVINILALTDIEGQAQKLQL